jgi:hypothetical protein
MTVSAQGVTALSPYSSPSLGTAAAPAYSFLALTSTGMYTDGSNLCFSVGGTIRLLIGTGAAQYSVGVQSSSPTGGIGYIAGAGGTVTQITSKATGVTLSKVCGEITMHNAALAAATIVSFVVTNTTIEANDSIHVQHQSGGTLGAYSVNGRCAAGSATIDIRNNTAGSLGEALVLRFAVIKGAVA